MKEIVKSGSTLIEIEIEASDLDLVIAEIDNLRNDFVGWFGGADLVFAAYLDAIRQIHYEEGKNDLLGRFVTYWAFFCLSRKKLLEVRPKQVLIMDHEAINAWINPLNYWLLHLSPTAQRIIADPNIAFAELDDPQKVFLPGEREVIALFKLLELR